MKVISWNILHGEQLPISGPAMGYAEACALLGADVLGLQEVDENQPRSGNKRQIEEIAELIGTEHWAYARSVIGTPGEAWRKPAAGEGVLHAEFNEPSYGIGLISKVPVIKWSRVELGRSLVGLPLPVQSAKGARFVYVKDEPRVALIAELENGFTIAVTHLSFVPFVNYLQLRKLQRVMKALPGKKIIMGDLNLGWNIPGRWTRWRSLQTAKTYPSWKPAIQFDYILAEKKMASTPLVHPRIGVSDHASIGVEIH